MTTEATTTAATTTTTAPADRTAELLASVAKNRAEIEGVIKFAKKSAEDLAARSGVERSRKKGDPKFVDQRMNDTLAEICEGRAEVWGDVATRLEQALAKFV